MAETDRCGRRKQRNPKRKNGEFWLHVSFLVKKLPKLYFIYPLMEKINASRASVDFLR